MTVWSMPKLISDFMHRNSMLGEYVFLTSVIYCETVKG